MLKNILTKATLLFCAFTLIGCTQTSTIFQQLKPVDPRSPTVSRANLTEDAFWQGDIRSIWDRLQHISLAKLEATATPTDATRAEWIKLAIISKRYNDNTNELVREVATWRKTYPNHPANAIFPNNATLSTLTSNAPPRHIALLLPLQGANGRMVRDGFLNAYYQSNNKARLGQRISFYDTSSTNNIGSIYQLAVSEGADTVVGPLMKEEVQNLLNSGSFPVPTLALNYTDSFFSLPKNVYEFGLSQTDEAEQIADKAWQKGRSRALLIAPQNAWGERISKNVIARWNSLGGKIVDSLYYSPGMDFNPAVANLLHATQESNGNKTKSDETIPLEKRRRQDFDVVFLLAEPQSARTIVPLLKFYYVDTIPIYATSTIYSGSPNPQKDSDLNGVIFADIPWVLKSSKNSNRLYAIGRDAYTISNQLPRLINLPNSPLYAETGALTMTSKHQIYHRLPMATMRNGHP